MKIYTKTGDKGLTSLLSGNRVPKFHLRIETYGTIDELNTFIGLLRSLQIDTHTNEVLINIQHKLFNIGSNLALDENKNNIQIPEIGEHEIEFLEHEMDAMDAQLPLLTNFILPGGNQTVATCHICRTVCRRAERLTVHLATKNEINIFIIKYLNRLADYFFVLARKLALDLNVFETIWKK